MKSGLAEEDSDMIKSKIAPNEERICQPLLNMFENGDAQDWRKIANEILNILIASPCSHTLSLDFNALRQNLPDNYKVFIEGILDVFRTQSNNSIYQLKYQSAEKFFLCLVVTN